MKMFFILILVSIAITGCESTPSKPMVFYKQPEMSGSTATFVGEESEAVIFGKGHEKIHICKVDGESIPLKNVEREIVVDSGIHTLNVCYREGGNSAEASFSVQLVPASKYQVKLGEHSWTKVNFSIIELGTNQNLIDAVTVPKIAGDVTILVF